MEKTILDYTKTEFLEMENFMPKQPFTDVIIVFTRKKHNPRTMIGRGNV